MIASRNSSLLLLVLTSTTLYGIFFHGDRSATAFLLKPQDSSRCGGGIISSNIDVRHHSSEVLILHSFSYLGGLDTDGNEDNVVEYQTAEVQLPQQPFPFVSSTIPSPTSPPPLQQEEEVESPETELYFEDDLDLNYPAYPEPEVIANPYDFTPLREEEDEITEFIPTVVAPVVPRSANSITRATSRAVTPAVNHNVRSIWETDAPAVVQGGSLKTWNFDSERIQAVQVLVKTNGRPLKADIELWQGESAPQKISVYTEDGEKRPFSAFVATPYPGPTAIAVKNSANMEFPLKACVEADLQHGGSNDFGSFGPGYGNHLAKHTLQRLWDTARPKTIQGDRATYVVPFEANIGRVQILITSEKNPINARIEILEGPNNVKQVLEIATEDGKARPFFCVLELPDKILTNVLRVVNTGPLEFPIECRVKPFEMEKELEPDLDDENFYFFDDVGPAAAVAARGGTSSSPFLLS